jgi:hypothetical protein
MTHIHLRRRVHQYRQPEGSESVRREHHDLRDQAVLDSKNVQRQRTPGGITGPAQPINIFFSIVYKHILVSYNNFLRRRILRQTSCTAILLARTNQSDDLHIYKGLPHGIPTVTCWS